MSTFKPLYSGSATAITLTMASLANSSYQQSTGVDNTTNPYQEALITGKVKSGASGVSASGYVVLYVAGYDGTQYANNATGTNGSFTVDAQANLTPICNLSVTANATTFYFPAIEVASAAGWLFLPQKWAIIMFNGSGAALDATAGNFTLEYQGINTQAV